MKKKTLLLILIHCGFLLQAQITISDRAKSFFTDGDQTAVQESEAIFQRAKEMIADAESIDEKNSSYNTPKKMKKWESKTAEAKQIRTEAALLQAQAYEKLAGVYKRIISSGKYEFEDDHAAATEYLNEGDKTYKKGLSRISKYQGQKSKQFKKTGYTAINKDIEVAESSFSSAFSMYEEAVNILAEQQEKKAKEESDNNDWNRAEAADNTEGYKSYIANHPDGKYYEQAQRKLADLEQMALEKAQSAVTYRVQLLADQKVWTKDKVKALFPSVTVNDIDEWFDENDNYFKYCTGKFERYSDARTVCDKLKNKRKDVFVIAFMRGYQVDITEARTATNELDGTE